MSHPEHHKAAILQHAGLTPLPPAATGSGTPGIQVIKELGPVPGGHPEARRVLLQHGNECFAATLEPDNLPALKASELTSPNDVTRLQRRFDELAAVKDRNEAQRAGLALVRILIEVCQVGKPVSAVGLWRLVKEAHLLPGATQRLAENKNTAEYMVHQWRLGFTTEFNELHDLLTFQAQAELEAGSKKS